MISRCSFVGSSIDQTFSLRERGEFFLDGAKTLCTIPSLAIATGYGLIGCVTLGQKEEAGNRLQSQRFRLVSRLYRSILGIVYPKTARCISQTIPSFAENIAIKSLIRMAIQSAGSESTWVKRKIVSRLQFGLAALAAVVARVVVIPLGLLTAVYSFIPLLPGRKIAAQLAFNELQLDCIIQDLLFCLTRIFNPQAKIYYMGQE